MQLAGSFTSFAGSKLVFNSQGLSHWERF